MVLEQDFLYAISPSIDNRCMRKTIGSDKVFEALYRDLSKEFQCICHD